MLGGKQWTYEVTCSPPIGSFPSDIRLQVRDENNELQAGGTGGTRWKTWFDFYFADTMPVEEWEDWLVIALAVDYGWRDLHSGFMRNLWNGY